VLNSLNKPYLLTYSLTNSPANSHPKRHHKTPKNSFSYAHINLHHPKKSIPHAHP
jgi:hypothetical protein